MATGPLQGVRVLELTRLLPGGFAGSLLADLGAEVIKVERPGVGDPLRLMRPRVGDESAASWVVDRGKRSLALDLKDGRGVEALKRLAGRSDALVESFRPGVLARLGVGYEALREVNPRLVYVSITGYGQDGPLAGEAGHDLNYAGRAGILSVTSPAHGPPVIPGVQIADLGAGALLSLVGLLAALLRARETGAGDHVDVSMTDGAFAWLSIHLGDYFATEGVPSGGRMPLNGLYPCYNVYECADGAYLTVAALEDRFWVALCAAVGRPELEHTHFEAGAVELWRELFRGRARDEWLTLLSGHDACVGPVNDLAEEASDPQLAHRRMVVEQEHATAGAFRQVGVPIQLRESPGSIRTPAPALGEGTRHYLAEAGYGRDEIEDLLRAGVVSEPAAQA